MPDGDYNCGQAGQYDYGGVLKVIWVKGLKEATFLKGAFISSFWQDGAYELPTGRTVILGEQLVIISGA